MDVICSAPAAGLACRRCCRAARPDRAPMLVSHPCLGAFLSCLALRACAEESPVLSVCRSVCPATPAHSLHCRNLVLPVGGLGVVVRRQFGLVRPELGLADCPRPTPPRAEYYCATANSSKARPFILRTVRGEDDSALFLYLMAHSTGYTWTEKEEKASKYGSASK